MKTCLSFCLLLVGLSAFAQSNETYVQRTIDCESIGRNTQSCSTQLDQTFNVQFATQLSRDACIAGRTYQINGNVITVSAGCRADFVAQGLTSYVQPSDQVLGSTVTVNIECDSNGDRPASCTTPFTQIFQLQVAQQYSGHPCIQGQSFQIAGNMIQVSHGCRANFMVTGLQMGAPQPPPPPPPPAWQPPQPPVSPAGPMCVLSYNPAGSSCTQYQLFDSRGTALTSCMYNLSDVQTNMSAMINLGSCSGPQMQTCTVKFNPAGSSCTQYQIFGNNNALSGCLYNTNDAQASLNSLRQLGFCAY